MKDYETYFKLAEKPVKGLTALEVALGLTHVRKINYEPLFLDAKGKHQTFNLARQGKAQAYVTLRERRVVAAEYLADVKGYLTGFLGSSWSAAWAPLGFINGKLALPNTDAGRCQMLAAVQAYFGDHEQHENQAMNYTAAYAETLCGPLTDAVSNVEDCRFDVRTKRDARDAAIRLLDKKLSALRNELETVLDPMDPRWLKFFDRIPGDPRVPEKVEDVTATAQPNLILVDWPDAERAARYRLLKQVVGTDADFVLADTVDESEAQLTGVPAGATVKLQVVPINGAGSGAASDVIELLAA